VKELTISKTEPKSGVTHPLGKYIDPVSGKAVGKRVLLDCTYISDDQMSQLRSWLQADSGLTADQLKRIVEVNVDSL
jgi:hypothetical protein